MTVNELLPSVTTLSHVDKIRLVQIMLEQLANDAVNSAQQKSLSSETFNPRYFFGADHQSKQIIDDYIASSREEWH